jgi:2-oxoglutarate ferredoxin oxidoreductase subunit alpha
MVDFVNVRISGANGDGIESAAMLLAKAIGKNKFHLFGFRSYQSVIRGGNVWFQISISNKKPLSIGNDVDILVALDIDAIKNNISSLNEKGIILYDEKIPNVAEQLKGSNLIALPFPMLDVAVKVGGTSIYRNTFVIGIIGKMLGLSKESIESTITEVFKRKPEVVKTNIDVAMAAYDTAISYDISRFKIIATGERGDKYLLSGNDAIALGAAAAGCKFYAAYPMTPASSIMDWFASHEDHGILYKQPEDEITAINMTIGAASTGVRAMCGTSGGGFSLMVEALGLAGMLEVPIVVIESQRGGPSTGLPTKTEQGDLLFVSHASQGEFPRVVIAPRNVEECFYEMANAFNIAERYQCPVIVLLDLFLSEHVETVDIDPSRIVIDRGLIVMENKDGKRFKRYLITKNGISPRALPGTSGLAFVAPSDEHDEYGDLVSDTRAGTPEGKSIRMQMHEKRMRKIDTMFEENNIPLPEVINENAKTFFVTFGSSTNSCIEAMNILKESEVDIGVISFSYMLPFNSDKIKQLLENKNLIDVECNYTGQLSKLIAMYTGVLIKDKILSYDGEALSSRDVAERAKIILKKGV